LHVVVNGKDIQVIDLTTGMDRNAFSVAVLDYRFQIAGWLIRRITFVVGARSCPRLDSPGEPGDDGQSLCLSSVIEELASLEKEVTGR